MRYLGVIPRQELSEFGFQIENPDKTVRLLILTIANSIFREKQLMMQEAPDLCYQKILADLQSATPGLVEEVVPISESDVAKYRAGHPNARVRGKSSAGTLP